MKHLFRLIAFILLLVPSFSSAQEKAPMDSTSAGLTKKDISLIMNVFNGQELSVIKSKADQLISSADDSLDKAFIAYNLFDHFYHSKIMGYEEVALYIADNYFLNKRLNWPDEEGFLLLKMFAEFNRSSMIGMLSPELSLPDSLGKPVSVRNTDARYKLLFFYDVDCAVCKAYTYKLMKDLKTFNSESIAVFRIYTQSDREKWIDWVRRLDKAFPVSDKVSVYDVWDPDFSSDFQRKFGVVSTPQLLLLDRDNFIIGRKLDPNAVSTIIDMDFNKPSELDLFIDQLFTSILPYDASKEVDTALVVSTIDDLYERSKKDTALFRNLFLSTYKYLKTNDEYNLQRGAAYIGNKYILQNKGMWKGKEDSFFSETSKAVELFYRNQLGKPAVNLYLTTDSKSPYSLYDSNTDYTVLYFYNMDCALCEAVSADMKKIYKDFAGESFEILAIYTGRDKKKWPKYVKTNEFEWVNLWDKSGNADMFAKYDLSGVPAIYILDKDKNTIAKDITPAMLRNIFDILFKKQ